MMASPSETGPSCRANVGRTSRRFRSRRGSSFSTPSRRRSLSCWPCSPSPCSTSPTPPPGGIFPVCGRRPPASAWSSSPGSGRAPAGWSWPPRRWPCCKSRSPGSVTGQVNAAAVGRTAGAGLLGTAEVLAAWWAYRRLGHGARALTDPRSAVVFVLLAPGATAAIFAASRALLDARHPRGLGRLSAAAGAVLAEPIARPAGRGPAAADRGDALAGAARDRQAGRA